MVARASTPLSIIDAVLMTMYPAQTTVTGVPIRCRDDLGCVHKRPVRSARLRRVAAGDGSALARLHDP
jgi:hypothetical protein